MCIWVVLWIFNDISINYKKFKNLKKKKKKKKKKWDFCGIGIGKTHYVANNCHLNHVIFLQG